VSNFRLSTRKGNGYVKVALRGELDLADAPDVTEALTAAVSRGPLVLVDMSGLNFIDVSGVSALGGQPRAPDPRGGAGDAAAPRESS
jgi:anti-sigma B factor antagonist